MNSFFLISIFVNKGNCDRSGRYALTIFAWHSRVLQYWSLFWRLYIFQIVCLRAPFVTAQFPVVLCVKKRSPDYRCGQTVVNLSFLMAILCCCERAACENARSASLFLRQCKDTKPILWKQVQLDLVNLYIELSLKRQGRAETYVWLTKANSSFLSEVTTLV